VATRFACLIEAVIKPHNNNMNVYSKNSANDMIILQGIVDKKPKHAATFPFNEHVVSTGIASRWIFELYTAGWPKRRSNSTIFTFQNLYEHIRVDLRLNCNYFLTHH